MKKSLAYLFCMLFSALWMMSCSTTKRAEKSLSIDGMDKTEYVEKVLSSQNKWQAVTARMTLELKADGKKSTSVGGSLRIKRGEVIQLSLAPLLGIEIGRAEITPEGMLVVDRINKRYVRVSFEELKALSRVDLTYDMLQALFLNEMFAPGKSRLSERDVKCELGTDKASWELRKGKPFSYRYLTELPEGRLTRSEIGLMGTAYGVHWTYADFRSLAQDMFPTHMEASFEGSRRPLSAVLHLSRLSVNGDWESHTTISSKYQKVELADLIKILF